MKWASVFLGIIANIQRKSKKRAAKRSSGRRSWLSRLWLSARYLASASLTEILPGQKRFVKYGDNDFLDDFEIYGYISLVPLEKREQIILGNRFESAQPQYEVNSLSQETFSRNGRDRIRLKSYRSDQTFVFTEVL